MSLFEKMDASFFTILVSKNKDRYVDLLLEIHDCIYRNQTMSMERSLLVDLLEEYVKDREISLDFKEEEEYAQIETELRQERIRMEKISSFYCACLKSMAGSM